MRINTLPTVGAIQRSTILVALLAAAVLLVEVSPASAGGCILGAALMVANLTALSWTVRVMFTLAQQRGGANRLGLLGAPLKMLLLVAIVYMIIASGEVNLPGFIAGSLTQFVAIFIEVGRPYFRKSLPLQAEQQEG
ncbi:MAG: ATP synthase subunit I [Deltaproteobacteria bacterium]|nr:ATP synthase subunit I [Deltaproteobacteria bacterium]